MSLAVSAVELDGLKAAMAELRAAVSPRSNTDQRDAHAWAARVLLEDLCGAEGERPAWHVKHGRLHEALAEVTAAVVRVGTDA